MERRRFPFWGLAGIAVLGGMVSIALALSGYVPVKEKIYIDLYTVKFKTTKSFLGLPMDSEIKGNVAMGMIPGVNLNDYVDAQGRSLWRVVELTNVNSEFLPVRNPEAQAVINIRAVASKIALNPKPGFRSFPQHGFEREAKQQVVLNCLEVFRETSIGDEVINYFIAVVGEARTLNRAVEVKDLLTPDEFLNDRDKYSTLTKDLYVQFRGNVQWPQLLESSYE